MSTGRKAPHYVIIFNSLLPHPSHAQRSFSAPCSQTSSTYLCSSLNLRHQVSQPYKTTGKIIVLYMLMFFIFV